MKDLGHGFTLIGKSIYRYNSETFTNLKKEIDFDTFELIDSYEDKTFYFRDKDKVYVTSYMCTPSVVRGANAKTFEIVDIKEGIAKDGCKYYWYDTLLPYDYSIAERINEYYLREGNKIYFITEQVENADADSFSIIWQNIARDKSNLYFKGKIEQHVDVNNFKMIPGCFNTFHLDQSHTYYAADLNNVYFINTLSKGLKKLSHVKPSDFSVKIIDEKLYGVTDKNIYYFGIKKKMAI